MIIIRSMFFFAACVCAALISPPLALADDASSASAPQPYDKFTAEMTAQHGLFTVWRNKEGMVYLELAPGQLGKDFIAAGQPVNGVGGFTGVSQGNYYFLPARLIRFDRVDNKVVITWPNTDFTAPPGSAQEHSVQNSFARSVVSVTKIAAVDEKTGDVVFDASAFLDDVIDLTDALRPFDNPDPSVAYRLDKDRTYFASTKAFPQNVLIQVNQTWTTDKPMIIDTVPDPRGVEIKVAYNIVEPPVSGAYMPRLADPRVGYFNQTVLDFGDDQRLQRQMRYIVRWNFKPDDPAKSVSPATNPIVFYLSNEIPIPYREPIRQALLSWNAAFERAGISDAVQVREQPTDPTWDPDDVRYSVVRWVSGSVGSGGAEAQLLYDPRTGEEFRTGITIDADIMRQGVTDWQYFTSPSRRRLEGSTPLGLSEAEYAAGAHQQAEFGRVAMRLDPTLSGGRTPAGFDADFLKSIALHESGHDMGLQHNFIGSQAYSARDIQSTVFTGRYGIVSSVMEYTPLNVWPGTPRGAYFQTILGPYDYYAIHWGYAHISGARTPEEEVPTLNRWAQRWPNPWYRFASDEDIGGPDPRVALFDLTNDTLSWCSTQMNLDQNLLGRLDSRFPWPGEAYDRERDAFLTVFGQYLGCFFVPAKVISGEFMSRSHLGDPGSAPPLVPVSRSEANRAFLLLEKYLLSDSAFHFSPATLNRLTYSEFTSLKSGSWIYQAAPRHDVAVVEMIAQWQSYVLGYLFGPLNLERVDDMSLKAKPGQTMSLLDLFDWMKVAVYGGIGQSKTPSVPLIRRNLQQMYTRTLINIATAPSKGTPEDAQSLARAELVSLQGNLGKALSLPLDEMTRAHYSRLEASVSQALAGRYAAPPQAAGGSQ